MTPIVSIASSPFFSPWVVFGEFVLLSFLFLFCLCWIIFIVFFSWHLNGWLWVHWFWLPWLQTPHLIFTQGILKVSDHAKEPSHVDKVFTIWNCDALANLKYCVVPAIFCNDISTSCDVCVLLMAFSFGVGIDLEHVSWKEVWSSKMALFSLKTSSCFYHLSDYAWMILPAVLIWQEHLFILVMKAYVRLHHWNGP